MTYTVQLEPQPQGRARFKLLESYQPPSFTPRSRATSKPASGCSPSGMPAMAAICSTKDYSR